MSIKIKFFGFLRERSGKKILEISAKNKKYSLKEIFEKIGEILGQKVIEGVFEDFQNFKLKQNIIVLVNGIPVSDPNKIISEGDTISIMPFLSGGFLF